MALECMALENGLKAGKDYRVTTRLAGLCITNTYDEKVTLLRPNQSAMVLSV